MGCQQASEGDKIRLVPFGVESALRCGGKQVLRQIAAVQAVHRGIRIAYRHGAKGIAVVALTQGEEALARFAARLPVLQRHLQCHLDGNGAGVGQKHALQRLGVIPTSFWHRATAEGWVTPPNMTWAICASWRVTA